MYFNGKFQLSAADLQVSDTLLYLNWVFNSVIMLQDFFRDVFVDSCGIFTETMIFLVSKEMLLFSFANCPTYTFLPY